MSVGQNATAICNRAQGLLEQGRYDEAQSLLLPLTVGAEQSAQAHDLLAMLAVTRNEPEPALHHALQASRLMPDNPSVWFTLGRAHKLAGHVAEAISAYRQALARQPGFAPAWVSLGIALRQNGELDAAIESYQKAIALAPNLGVAHGNLANALVQRAQRDAAADSAAAVTPEVLTASQKAVELTPDDAQVLYNHAVLLYRAGHALPAAEFFSRSLALDSSSLACILDLGQLLTDLGRPREAITAYEKWLQLNPPNDVVQYHLGFTLLGIGRVSQALRVAEDLVQTVRDRGSLNLLGNAYLQARQHAKAREVGEQLKSLGFDGFLLGINYFLEDPQEIFAAHELLRQSLLQQLREQQVDCTRPSIPAARPERLNVGFVSGDFAEHAVTSFMMPLLRNIDRERFAVTLYSNRMTEDTVTQQVQAVGHQWFDCLALNDKQLLDRVRADQIHVLFDLAGHTQNGRIALFALPAAPVQIAYLGYPTISGAPAMDWRLTDGCIDPGDMPTFGGEQPLVLSRSMFCFQPNTAPDIRPAPQLRNGVITFGSFNNVAKISDVTLALWAQVLQAVPQSRLLLKASGLGDEGTQRNLLDYLISQGISEDRVTLHARIPAKADHLSLYNEIDVALDCYPYNGATTTCEALWMGVPVVSLRGRTHTSRMGHSILTAAGRPEWVCQDTASYMALAVSLAADLDLRVRWREQARNCLQDSELFDGAGMARCVEAALDGVWEQAARKAHSAN